MNPTREICHELTAYMARDTVAYVGPFEAVYNAMFGPFQHDAHVTARKAHIEAGSLAERLRRADEAVRAECARQTAEFRARVERNRCPALIAAE